MLSLFHVRRALLYEVDPADGTLLCTAAAGDRDPHEWLGERIAVGSGAAGRAFASGEAVLTRDVLSDPETRLPERLRRRLEIDGFRAVAALPLVVEGQTLGVLSVSDTLGRAFTPRDLDMLTAFADQAATALENVRLYEESERRRHASEALADVGRLLSETLDAAVVGQRIADSVRRLLGASASTVYALQPDSGNLVAIAGSGQSQIRRDLVFLRGTGVAGLAVHLGRIVVTPNLLADPRITLTADMRRVIEDLDYRAVLALPLRVQDRIIGALGVGDRAGRIFDDDEIRLVERFADQAALALENARLYESTTRRQREAEIIAELSRSIGASLDLPVVLRRVTEAARELCGADMGRIALRDPETSEVRFRHWVGPLSAEWRATPIVAGRGFGGQALASGRPFRTDNYLGDPRVDQTYALIARREGVVAALVVPIPGPQQAQGLLFVINQSPRPFTDRDEEVLTRLAEHAAIAITNAELYEQAEAARRDAERAADALRESEEQYRALVEGSLQGICIHQDFAVRFANSAMARIFGYERAADLIGTDYRMLMAPEERPRIEALLAARLRGDRVPWQYEVAGRRRDGTPISLHLLATLVRWQGGPAVQVAVLDTTEQRSLEAQLRQAQKMEAVGQLAGGVAHDFNNLLTVILGRSQLLQRRVDPGGAESRDIELIRETAARAAVLTRQLLAFSRRQVLDPRVLDLNQVLGGMAPMLRRLIGEDIELRVEPGLPLDRVLADPAQIEQVILNLVVNARDAMPGGGRLTLETANVELDEAYARGHVAVQAGPCVALAVSDTGTGMDADTQTHLFEPFFTTKQPGKGTGLGLATVYGIVKQSGGHISVVSEPGQGTTFTIYLPRADQAPDETSPAPITRPAGGRETILLVEDEPEVRSLAREILEEYGYTVLEAGEPHAALAMCTQHEGPVHLLVTDVIMPAMNGRQLAAALGLARPAMKVLFVSGYTDTGNGVLESGAAFVAKPFTPDGLARKVRDVLDRPC